MQFQHVLELLPSFLLACVILAVLPGPATALFLHRSVRDGRAAGLAAVVGNEIGLFGWTLAGGAGLSVLLLADRALSVALHVVGAAILIWLGVSAWRHEASGRGRGDHVAAWTNARSGVSRVAGFHRRESESGCVRDRGPAAVLPPSGPVLPTLLLLAVIQLVIDTAWCAGVVLAAGRAREILGRAHIRRRCERVLGALLMALGVGLAADLR